MLIIFPFDYKCRRSTNNSKILSITVTATETNDQTRWSLDPLPIGMTLSTLNLLKCYNAFDVYLPFPKRFLIFFWPFPNRFELKNKKLSPRSRYNLQMTSNVKKTNKEKVKVTGRDGTVPMRAHIKRTTVIFWYFESFLRW